MDDVRLSIDEDETSTHISRVLAQHWARKLGMDVKDLCHQPEDLRPTQALVGLQSL